MKLVFAAGFVALVLLFGDGSSDSIHKLTDKAALPTVPTLNVTKYLGRWYQMYEDPLVKDTFERKGYCVTADYGLFPNGSISVKNGETVDGPTGKPKIYTGYAEKDDPKVAGKLHVHLSGVPFPGVYWVVLLGPDTYGPDMKYQFAVVTDNHSETLFVLARNVTEFKTNYDTPMLQNLTKLGFDHFYNKPIATYQESDCQYV